MLMSPQIIVVINIFHVVLHLRDVPLRLFKVKGSIVCSICLTFSLCWDIGTIEKTCLGLFMKEKDSSYRGISDKKFVKCLKGLPSLVTRGQI